jgi:UrcA family protein
MKSLVTSVTLALALCALQANCLAAAPTDEVRTRSVSYADLNLKRPTDAALLYRRIEGAAELVCEPYASRDLARNMRFRQCRSSAIHKAIADVRAPLLTERYATLANLQILAPQAARLNP